MSVNKVILVGNLGNDPEARKTNNGTTVAEFRLATSESWTDSNKQRQTRTEWHRVVVYGNQAESVAKYLRKGRQAYVEGKLTTREWTDKENVKRYTTEIIASQVVFLGGGSGGSGGQGGSERQDFSDNDIPF